MSPPPPGTKQQWIDMYKKEEEEDSQKLLALTVEYNKLCQYDASGNNNLHLCVILLEYGPSLPIPISDVQQGYWDKTHPKTRIGVMMKGCMCKKIVFLRDNHGHVTLTENDTYNEKCKQMIIP
eukprot:14186645-Ditylum_brightwellii.AAC.1